MTAFAPRCCDRPMRLVGIEDYDGEELHTFECGECRKVDAVKNIDPSKAPPLRAN